MQCGDNDKFFVGAGAGSVNLILNSSGLTNLFAHLPGGYACINASKVIKLNPDVVVIVEASWDSALNKIDYMHNQSSFCDARFVKQADYITIPFSASALGPRNGAAALDLASVAIHVTTGAPAMNFQSGVQFFDPSARPHRLRTSPHCTTRTARACFRVHARPRYLLGRAWRVSAAFFSLASHLSPHHRLADQPHGEDALPARHYEHQVLGRRSPQHQRRHGI